MRIDASGNLGLGVTPSAWTTLKAVQLPAGSIAGFDSGTSGRQMNVLNNAFFDGTNFIYVATGPALAYRMLSGAHQWNTAPSGTAGNAISFTQAMTLDASGNLVIGATSNGVAKIYTFTTSGGVDNFRMADENSTVASGIRAVGDAIAFRTQATERARITSGGDFGIGLTPSGSYKLEVNGTAAATDFNSTSDRNKKTNIATITAALDKVQALRGVTFDWIADGKASTGLIAQEVEQVMPQVVQGDEGNKTVSYGSLVGLLIEAVKEQQATINQLTNRIAALEGK